MGNKSSKSKQANSPEKSNKLRLGQVEPVDHDAVDEPDNESWRPNTVLSKAAQRQFDKSVDKIIAQSDKISQIPYEEYEYPFENLVFEGGGAKGQVYVGCMQIIEKMGIKVKRFSGASAGAICAALLAAGYDCKELEKELERDLDTVLLDHSCGIFSLLPNLIRNFGWNPGKKFVKEFGILLEKKLGDPDITFKQLYKKTGNELCVTAVNVNMLSCEYFHPKTTPNMPIRLAVRMSLSIPGIFEAVKYKNNKGHTDMYIDGGLLCNYPIHAFDGWWLSMKQEDSFLNRLQPLSEMHKLMDKRIRFGGYNEKTLGFLVYSALEQDVMQTELDKRLYKEEVKRPEESKLYKSRADILKSKKKALEEHEVFLQALDRFMKTLNRINDRQTDRVVDDVIDKEELKQAIKMAKSKDISLQASLTADMTELSKHDIEVLFGENADIDQLFDDLDVDDSGYISYDELILFVEKSGIDIQAKFQGYDRKELKSVGDYILGLQDCLLTNVKKMFLDDRDLDRTVGINTDYISTSDFRMQQIDREFCFEQGRKATEAFFRHYVYHYPDKVKKKSGVTNPQKRSHDHLGHSHSGRKSHTGVPSNGGEEIPKPNQQSSSPRADKKISGPTKLPPIVGSDKNTNLVGKLPPLRGIGQSHELSHPELLDQRNERGSEKLETTQFGAANPGYTDSDDDSL